MRARIPALLAGAGAAVLARGVLEGALLAVARQRVDALNGGDPGPLLALYADDAVLEFPGEDHRFAGVHRGRDAVEAFLRAFVDAGVQGRVEAVWMHGWPWRARAVLQFSDVVVDDGRTVYANDALLLLETRWGRVVRQVDFLADTGRVADLEQHLRVRGR